MIPFHSLFSFAVWVLVPLTVALSTPARAATYDALVDYTLASNPNGVWAYGYGITSLTLYSRTAADATDQIWTTPLGFPDLRFIDLTTAAHPDDPNSLILVGDSTLDFTAPSAGLYDFESMSYCTNALPACNVTVNLYKVSGGVATHLLDLGNTAASHSLGVMLGAGDRLALVTARTATFDAGIYFSKVVISTSEVPEPSTWLSIMAGLGLLATRRWRK
ncbi:MAG: PEP-CTERM sorting domain-containing protein [Acidobacteria bacterium]|nr:PEP-CTERM sorting domain-containing protein [Acidobacteriota bacterium]